MWLSKKTLESEHYAKIRDLVLGWDDRNMEMLNSLLKWGWSPTGQVSRNYIQWMPQYSKLRHYYYLFKSVIRQLDSHIYEDASPQRMERTVRNITMKLIYDRLREHDPDFAQKFGKLRGYFLPNRYHDTLMATYSVLSTDQFGFVTVPRNRHQKFAALLKFTGNEKYLVSHGEIDGENHYAINIYSLIGLGLKLKSYSSEPVSSLDDLDNLGLRYCSRIFLYLPGVNSLHIPKIPNMSTIQLVCPHLRGYRTDETVVDIEIYCDPTLVPKDNVKIEKLAHFPVDDFMSWIGKLRGKLTFIPEI